MDSTWVDAAETEAEVTSKKWYEKINIRGYTQVRYNRLLETNPQLNCEQCDRSWGENGGISFCRICIIFFGQLHERLSFYIQPDFASSAPASTSLRSAMFTLTFFSTGNERADFGLVKVKCP